MTLSFPIGHTADQRRFRIDALLLGEGSKRLFLGTELSTDQTVLVSVNVKPSQPNVVSFRAEMNIHEPGLFELGYIGSPDFVPGDDISEQHSHWVLVERLPEGSWLPSFVGTDPEWRHNPVSRKRPGFERAAAVTDALSLGVSLGRLVQRASRVPAYIHPEMTWAQRVGGELVVTGYTTRPRDFFRQTKLDAYTIPLFDRFYHAPEAFTDPGEKSLVFSLSIMIAEWATGRFPYRYNEIDLGPHAGKPLPLKLPSPLEKLLTSGMRLERKHRPDLTTFLETLEQLR